MKKHLALAILYGCLYQPSFAAEGIDQVYESSSSRTWGERLLESFQRPNFNKSYAVVIGISNFRDFSTLSNPEDPKRIKDYLLNEAGFDYVHLLTEDKVTPSRVRQIMVDELRNKIVEQDRLLFYWAGHGTTLRTGERSFGYLPTAHSKKDEYSEMLDMEDLAKWDKRLNAKQTLYLLDACFSGGAAVVPQSDNQARTLKQIARPSRQILTAGLANQETFVLPELGSSVFTHAILDGLRGKADLPIEGVKDGVVSARELELFVKKRVDDVRVEVDWKNPITPQLSRLPNSEEGDFFFFSPKTVTAAKEDTEEVQSSNASEAQAMSKLPTERLPFEPQMIPIPAGSFTMGCLPERDVTESITKCFENELPAHSEHVAAFEMGKYEITKAQFRAFIEATGYQTTAETQGTCYGISRQDKEWKTDWIKGYYWDMVGFFEQSEDHPVVCVSWDDAQAYIRWLNQQTGKSYYLPSEVEWEYAARGGKGGAYPWGTKQIACGNALYFDKECISLSSRVGAYAKNGFGLYDTAGNVWEWTQSHYNESYDVASVAVQQVFVLRGGSWFNDSQFARSASRFWFESIDRSFNVGFRVSRSL